MKTNKGFAPVVTILIIIAILLQINAMRVGYVFFSSQIQAKGINLPIDSGLFFTLFGLAAFTTVIYIIAYIISLVLIIKNKTSGYLISGIAASLTFFGSLQDVIKNQVGISFVMVVTMIFWIALIIVSFRTGNKIKGNVAQATPSTEAK